MTPENLATIEAALAHPSISEDAAVSAIEALSSMRTRDWDVRVLDAWAASDEGCIVELADTASNTAATARHEKRCSLTASGIGTQSDPRVFYANTPDAARHAAALALWPALSPEDQARIGSCP